MASSSTRSRPEHCFLYAYEQERRRAGAASQGVGELTSRSAMGKGIGGGVASATLEERVAGSVLSAWASVEREHWEGIE